MIEVVVVVVVDFAVAVGDQTLYRRGITTSCYCRFFGGQLWNPDNASGSNDSWQPELFIKSEDNAASCETSMSTVDTDSFHCHLFACSWRPSRPHDLNGFAFFVTRSSIPFLFKSKSRKLPHNSRNTKTMQTCKIVLNLNPVPHRVVFINHGSTEIHHQHGWLTLFSRPALL